MRFEHDGRHLRQHGNELAGTLRSVDDDVVVPELDARLNHQADYTVERGPGAGGGERAPVGGVRRTSGLRPGHL